MKGGPPARGAPRGPIGGAVRQRQQTTNENLSSFQITHHVHGLKITAFMRGSPWRRVVDRAVGTWPSTQRWNCRSTKPRGGTCASNTSRVRQS